MSTSQSEKKANGSTVRMPVHQIVVSPITGLLETHTITIRDDDQVRIYLFMLKWSPFADQTLSSLGFINIIYLGLSVYLSILYTVNYQIIGITYFTHSTGWLAYFCFSKKHISPTTVEFYMRSSKIWNQTKG